MRTWRALGIAAGLLLLNACGSTEIYLRGETELNVYNKQPRNVKVRIYLLKDNVKFRDADYEKLWEKPDELLAGVKVGESQEVTVFPGEEGKPVSLGDLDPAVRYVGIIALFPVADDEGPRHIVFPVDEVAGGEILLEKYHIDRQIH